MTFNDSLRHMKNIFLLFGLLIFSNSLFAQTEEETVNRCNATYHDSLRCHQHPNYAKHRHQFEEKLQKRIALKKAMKTAETEEEVYRIPVVVHVVHNGGASNISDEQILSQIQILNEDFNRQNADTTDTPAIFKDVATSVNIEFCLASRDPEGNVTNGITRSYSANLPYSSYSSSDNYALKAIDYWPSDQYLNIWVTEISNSVLGWAQFPDDSGLPGIGSGFDDDAITDGVVLDHGAFGNIGTALTRYKSYNRGRTSTHEIGHWLGLIHIWGDDDSCFGTDYCEDTPSQREATNSCPKTTKSSCGSVDMTQNFMDYTFDACMNLFTQDQKDRMRTAMETSPRRKALLSSPGCCGEGDGVAYGLPYYQNFNDSLFLQEGGWSISSSNPNLVWTIDGENGLLADNNTGNIGDSTILISPLLKLFSSSEMEFELAYGNISPTDSFKISYNLNCSPEWKPLLTFTGDSLVSTDQNPLTIPFEEDYKRIQLDLGNLQGYISFRFENYSKGQGPLFLRNFRIGQFSNELSFYLEPNPADQSTTLVSLFGGNEQVNIQIYSVSGQLVFEENNIPARLNTLAIQTENLRGGVYLVRLFSENKEMVKRLMVVRE